MKVNALAPLALFGAAILSVMALSTAPVARFEPSTALASPSASSAISPKGRVGITYVIYRNSVTQQIAKAMYERLLKDYANRSDFIAVPIDGGLTSDQEHVPMDVCQAHHVNAIMQPLIEGSSTGTSMHIGVFLDVEDCGAIDYDLEFAHKTEDRSFVHGTTEREAIDMANDMLDHTEKSLATFISSHEAAWRSLLDTGIGIDPKDEHFHALFSLLRGDDKRWSVIAIFPGGPADVAGVRLDDEVVSINGKSIYGLTHDQVDPMLLAQTLVLELKRSRGLTITVTGLKYPELLKSLHREGQ